MRKVIDYRLAGLGKDLVDRLPPFIKQAALTRGGSMKSGHGLFDGWDAEVALDNVLSLSLTHSFPRDAEGQVNVRLAALQEPWCDPSDGSPLSPDDIRGLVYECWAIIHVHWLPYDYRGRDALCLLEAMREVPSSARDAIAAKQGFARAHGAPADSSRARRLGRECG